MKRRIVILFALTALLGCTAGRGENPKASFEKFEIGESVYVCGCPMMCCNSISRTPGGRCACNVPLRKGTVSRIRGGKIYVNAAGREKVFSIPNR